MTTTTPANTDLGRTASASTEPAVDEALLLERVDGDLDLLAALVHIFLQQSATIRDDVGRAIAEGDGPALERSAHKAKGALLNLAATSASAHAELLERVGRSGDFACAGPAFEALGRELLRVELELVALASSTAPR